MPKSIAKRRCFENRYIHTKRERYIYGVEENVFMDKQAVGVQLGEVVVQGCVVLQEPVQEHQITGCWRAAHGGAGDP